MKIWSDNDHVLIVNFYNRGSRLSIKLLENVCAQAQMNVIWCGDFNSHSVIWGSPSTDANELY